MNMTCDTVTVVGSNGKPMRLNKADYDDAPEGTYTLVDPNALVERSETGAATALPPGAIVPPPALAMSPDAIGPSLPVENEPVIMQQGKKWHPVNPADGAKIVAPWYDPKGYDTQEAATEAVRKRPRPGQPITVPHEPPAV